MTTQELIEKIGLKFSVVIHCFMVRETDIPATASDALSDSESGAKKDLKEIVYLRSTPRVVLNTHEIQNQLDDSLEQCESQLDAYTHGGSGWKLQKVLRIDIEIAVYNPLKGGSYIPTPDFVPKGSVVNVRNEDNRCFMYSVLASVYPPTTDSGKNNNTRPGVYNEHIEKINLDGITYPVTEKYYKKFEAQNPTLALNVFAIDKKSFYPISLAFFVLACFSKGMAVVLPALLIITDWWILKKPFSVKELLDKIPYFVVTLIFAYIATHAQKDAGADATVVINAAYTPVERFKIISYSFLMYWVKAIFPINLIPFYPYPPKIDGSIPGIFSLAALGLILFAIAAFILGRKNKLIWWAVSFFVIAISTVIQILPVGSAIFADRYFYLSSIGPLFLFALGLDYLKKKSSMFQGFGYLIALIFAAITFFQTTHWKNLYTLFKPAEESYPEDAMVLSNLGWYYLGINDFLMAKQYLQRADNNGFKNADVCRTLGSMFVDEQNYPEALKYIEKSREFLPISPRTEWLTALAMLRTGQFEKALPYSEKAIEQNSTDFDFLTTHAQILTELKMYDKAEATNNEIIKLYPDK